MDRLALVLIGFVFGAAAGVVVAAGAGVTLDGHDHSDHAQVQATAHHGGAHDHEIPHSVPDGPDAPAVETRLMPDAVSGWNLYLATENFSFAPEKAGLKHVAGEGHAHVYLDGRKIARLYGPWMHLPALAAGTTVDVTLNANDHRPLAVGKTPVAARIRVAAE